MPTTHTPGPWIVGTTDGHATFNITGPKGALPYIAHIPSDRLERDVNARLIAAAPDMLKALQRLTHPMADDDDLAHALDVIARATT